MQDEDEIHIEPLLVPSKESLMPEVPAVSAVARRDEDIALDMMKFIATTTGYGRTSTSAAGFQAATESRAEDYARHLLELYGQCLSAVKGSR